MPASISIKQVGYEGLKKSLEDAGVQLSDVMTDTVTETTELMETATKLAIKQKDLLFRRLLLGSITREVSFEGGSADFAITGRVWSDQPYAEVMDLGRRPGKRPPVDAILPWVIAKIGPGGLPTEEKASGMRGLAFVIARSIGRKGIKGRHYFAKAGEIAKRNMPKILEKHVRAWLSGVRTFGGGN